MKPKISYTVCCIRDGRVYAWPDNSNVKYLNANNAKQWNRSILIGIKRS